MSVFKQVEQMFEEDFLHYAKKGLIESCRKNILKDKQISNEKKVEVLKKIEEITITDEQTLKGFISEVNRYTPLRNVKVQRDPQDILFKNVLDSLVIKGLKSEYERLENRIQELTRDNKWHLLFSPNIESLIPPIEKLYNAIQLQISKIEDNNLELELVKKQLGDEIYKQKKEGLVKLRNELTLLDTNTQILLNKTKEFVENQKIKENDPPIWKQYFDDLWNTVKFPLLGSLSWKYLGIGTIIAAAIAGAVYMWRNIWHKDCSKLEGPARVECEAKAIDGAINKLESEKKSCDQSSNPSKCKRELEILIKKWQNKKKEILS